MARAYVYGYVYPKCIERYESPRSIYRLNRPHTSNSNVYIQPYLYMVQEIKETIQKDVIP